jgi:hypothetical protein
MTPEHLESILKHTQAKEEKDGFRIMPEGTTLTLHVSHGGAGMSMPRVDAIRREGELLWARNGKKDVCAVATADVFAILIEGQPGSPVRRAGFGT